MAKYATVEAYIAAIPEPLAAVARKAREVTDQNLGEATLAIRWAQPVWSLGSTPVCYMRASSHHITYGFWHGASIRDPTGRLETSGHTMAHVKLRTVSDVDPKVFAGWLRQAHKIELETKQR